IERLMAVARKGSRYGHRDATMILVGYRHGLRASELCDLQWSQVELNRGRLHVRRAKNGSPSVHPLQGDEIRALRRLQREQGLSSHVFMTERAGQCVKSRSTPTFRSAMNSAHSAWPCFENVHDPTSVTCRRRRSGLTSSVTWPRSPTKQAVPHERTERTAAAR